MQVKTDSPAVRITLVEDNLFLLQEYLFQLQYLGFDVKACKSGVELDLLMQTWESDVYVLDVNLPGEDGFSIAKRLYNPARRSIIILSARTEIEDRIYGLAEGADLYLTKPIDIRELSACVHSLYRRLTSQDASLTWWSIDAATSLLKSPDGRCLELRPQELRLLLLLLECKDQTCSRQDVIDAFELNHLHFSEGRINTMVWRLRGKLQAFDTNLMIKTWRNAGYSYLGPSIRVL